METVVASIPLNKLKPSPANVLRQRQDAAIEELAASIKVHGLLQMPIVRPELNGDDKPTGSYFVDVGESRRQALQLLAKRKAIKRSEPIDCMVRAGDDSAEISLAENVVRMPMHPADQFEAFALLQRESGLQPDEIAARFGITTRTVKQRLKLAAVSASLMERYRAGDLTLDQLMAFAVTDDRELHEQVHSELGDRASPFAIRRRLTSTYVETDDRRVLFVGLAAYEQAGGAVLRDLFSAEDEGWAMDSVLLDRLVMEKLQVVAEQVRDEGWQWIDVAIDYPHDRTRDMRRVFPEQVALSEGDQAHYDELCARHDELASSGDDLSDQELDEISRLDVEIDTLNARQSVFDAEVRAKSGAIVCLRTDGNAHIDRGWQRPEDEPVEELQSTGDCPAEPAANKKPIADKLVAELTTERTLALQACLAERPDMALLATAHALALPVFYGLDGAGGSCLAIKSVIDLPKTALSAVAGSKAAQKLQEQREHWQHLLPEKSDDLWSWLVEQDEANRLGLLAFCLAGSIDTVRHRYDGDRRNALSADLLAGVIGFDMSAWWQPGELNYLSRVSKAHILEIVTATVSPEAAENIRGMKKAPMVKRAEELLAGTGWLPDVLELAQRSDDSPV